MANALNSTADAICPTYAAGTISKNDTPYAGIATYDILNDCVCIGSALTGGTVGFGYINQVNPWTVGSMNNGWANGCLSQNVTPTYSSGVLSFGNTGLQS